jgi:arginyl-tRNA synthetase
MFEDLLADASAAFRLAAEELGLAYSEDPEWVPIPFKGTWGFGTPACFQIAAAEAKSGKKINVPQRAAEIASLVSKSIMPPSGINAVEAERGYLNLFIQTRTFAELVIDNVLENRDDFGKGKKISERVMVEYAQPNTHHSFHIGHARNAMLGESLARLVEFAGFDTIRASYPGDIGLGVITCVWAYDKFYRGQEPEGVHQKGQWLAGIYTEATSLVTPSDEDSESNLNQKKSSDEERRDLLKKWDDGDPQVRALWKETRQWSLDELSEILTLLGIEIDVYFYESEVIEPAKEIVDELITLGIADDERPDGPVIVRIDEKLGLTKEKYRTAVILRSNGTALYLTNDLALAKEKFEKYSVDRSIYVVDVRQSLHFQQAFKILDLWGFPQAQYCHHLAYGFVTLPEGAMSARRGNVIFFMDVYEEAKRRVSKIIDEKNPDLPEDQREKVVHQVGLGALTYSMLAVDNNKDIVFNWDDALSFDGHSAPYIQNAHVRAMSILRRAGDVPDKASFHYDLDETEIELIDIIYRFQNTVKKAATEYKPLLMATYAYDLAKAFHHFYHAVRVLQADADDIRDARIRLTDASRLTLANALRLLGIEAPEMM